MNPNSIIAIVNVGDRIPFDGRVIDGLAVVDESAETGVSTPALLDSSEGRNKALAGTLVVEGWLKIESPLDARMRKPESNKQPSSQSQQSLAGTCKPVKISMIVLISLASAMLFAFIGYATTHSFEATAVTGIMGLAVGVYESWSVLMQ